MFYIGIKQVDWLLWHHRGLLIKHNVPVYMSTHTSVIVSCRIHLCFHSPSLCHSHSFSLWMSQKAHHDVLHVHLRLHPPHHHRRHPHNADKTLRSLPSLPLFCPSLAPTIPAPRLPAASLQPSSPPPPSELHCECLVQQPQPLLQYAALPCLYCAAPAKRSTASHLGSGEGKGSTSNCRSIQENKTALTPLSSSSQAVRIWMFADIYRFVSLQQKHTYPHCLCSRLSSHSHPLIHFK